MKGWKTKLGAALTALGLALSSVPGGDEVAIWIKFAGKIVASIGAAFTTWGIGHKIEKSRGS